MNRKMFLGVAGGAIILGGVSYYLQSDKNNFIRGDGARQDKTNIPLTPAERAILQLASLAPSGHNAQPWRVQYIEPYHWIIENDRSRWLPAVDPTQRETILSIGAFLQNLEYAAAHFGYTCQMDTMATTNQAEKIMELRLTKSTATIKYDTLQIKLRRTVRSNFLSEMLKKEDVGFLVKDDIDFIFYA